MSVCVSGMGDTDGTMSGGVWGSQRQVRIRRGCGCGCGVVGWMGRGGGGGGGRGGGLYYNHDFACM